MRNDAASLWPTPARADARGLPLGGLAPFSTLDFPGRLAAVLFTQGCPLACRYCHNPELRPRATAPARDWAGTLTWLRRRVGLLDAVVVSGGEPTIQPGLGDALAEIRALGFATGLHTAGVNAHGLAQALPLLDWVGFDVKAPFAGYDAVAGHAGSGAAARRALMVLLASGVAYEVRTTVHSALLGRAELIALARDLRGLGVRRWVLQAFRADGCQDAALLAQPGAVAFESVLPALEALVPEITIR